MKSYTILLCLNFILPDAWAGRSRNQRAHAFLLSSQETRDLTTNDDRHNPNVNTRNTTNNPALPFYTMRPTQRPSTRPTRKPTIRPTSRPSTKPTIRPSPKPSSKPSKKPSPRPTVRPTFRPSAKPSGQPTATPTFRPSENPTGQPTATPTFRPSAKPSGQPTATPTFRPSEKPTGQPTATPTFRPSAKPSGQPIATPTFRPSEKPTGQPTATPTFRPSAKPSGQPTAMPTFRPSAKPSGQPIATPTFRPSAKPSGQPIATPTFRPSAKPSGQPTATPTFRPSAKPSGQPIATPTFRPSAKPSGQPIATPTFRPSEKPTGQPTATPTFRPSAKPSGQPIATPTFRPSAKPSGQPTATPTFRPSAKPSGQPIATPTFRPSEKPTGQPTATPTFRPSAKPSGQPIATPTFRPSAKPSGQPIATPTFRPSEKPTGQPTARPTITPTTGPTITPTLFPTKNLCARDHYGHFGNTSSGDYMLVSYNYEMVTNMTIASRENVTIIKLVHDVEYAITNILLKSLFAECATYYTETMKRWLSGERKLASAQVIGISAQPNDIITGGTCDALSTVPSGDNIFTANTHTSSELSCDVLQGRLAIYVDETLITDMFGLEALYNMTRTLIKNGMDNRQLILMSNEAIVELRYVDEPKKDLLPITLVKTDADKTKPNNIIEWSLAGVAIVAFLLLLFIAARYVRKRSSKGAVFQNFDDDDVHLHSFEEMADFSFIQQSTESFGLQSEMRRYQGTSHNEAQVIESNLQLSSHAPESKQSSQSNIDDIDDFIEHRLKASSRMYFHQLVLPDDAPLSSLPEHDYIGTNCVTSHSSISLNYVYTKYPSIVSSEDSCAQNYTYEAMGTNRGVTPKCSICFKDADGLMRRCQCGKSSCDKIAHASCIYGRNPTPSISYPGTPPPMLPPVLCGSENRGLSSRLQNYDEENSLGLVPSKSMSFDESTYAEEKMRNSVMGCR